MLETRCGRITLFGGRMKSSSDIMVVALVPIAIALVVGAQQARLHSQSRAPEAKLKALACDVYRASWTSGALGLAMFGIAAFFLGVLVSFSNPDRIVVLGFCGLSVLFAVLGVHSIMSVFRASVHFKEDTFELQDGSHVQSLRYDELTSVTVASWH